MNLHDADLGKEVSDRTKAMSEIIAKINDTPFAKNSEAGDVLGTAYMILIGLFQSGAGKKGGRVLHSNLRFDTFGPAYDDWTS